MINECVFYHTMDLPGGTVFGAWDLRGRLDVYLGRVDYAARSVLEIGPASGLTTFEMERRGATVTAVDLPLSTPIDLFPSSPEAVARVRKGEVAGREAVRNSFWTAHRALGSKAKLVEGDACALDPMLTGFDIGVLCNVMQHLKNPTAALLSLAERAETVVVTEADWLGIISDERPIMQLVTDAIASGTIDSWYVVSPKLVEDVLTLAGFRVIARDLHEQSFTPSLGEQPQMIPHYTVTAIKAERSRCNK